MTLIAQIQSAATSAAANPTTAAVGNPASVNPSAANSLSIGTGEQSVFFAYHLDVWLGLLLGIVGAVLGAYGLFYAVKAFKEAEAAKKAANRAAQAAKSQVTVGELIELTRDLQLLNDALSIGAALSKLQETNTKLRRHLAPIRESANLDA